MRNRRIPSFVALSLVAFVPACTKEASSPAVSAWEAANPLKPMPDLPLGLKGKVEWSEIAFHPTPEKVRLGRWLFFDKRISADGTVACATCHRPENAFSEPTPHSTGVKGQQGDRKAPPVINAAWPIYPVFFWDGRAASLVEQAVGPMANPIEMGSQHDLVVKTIAGIASYRPYFKESFGDDAVTLERIAEAIASYEATRLSGNSKYDRFVEGKDKTALDEQEQTGRHLFFNKSQFHNLGIGWDETKKAFADEGRRKISKKDEELGAFKTPGLREVTKHAPYMHDGSLATLEAVVEHYNKGGTPNPALSPKVKKLELTPAEVAAVVAFMKALDGEGYADSTPAAFPK